MSTRRRGLRLAGTDHRPPPGFSLKRAAKLGAKKHREAERLFLAEGENLILESEDPPRALFTEPEQVRRLSALTTPTGPVGVFSYIDVSAEELLTERDRIVLLHGVQDPGNVGAVIRSAHAFDAGVALSTGCADLYNSKTVRATMGSLFHTPVSREIEPLGFLAMATRAGFGSVAAVPRGERRRTVSDQGKHVIVRRSEGRGLPAEVAEAARTKVTVPSQAASLNAAIAASILLYEAYSRVLP